MERSRRKKKATQISSSHFVGYVEDEESIASIMKKFEELEKYKSEVGINKPPPATIAPSKEKEKEKEKAMDIDHGPVLNDRQLEEIFKRTSSFTVKAAMMDHLHCVPEDEELWIEEEFANIEDDDDDADGYDGILDEEFWDDNEVLPKEKKERKVKKVGEKRKKMTREEIIHQYKITQLQLRDQQGNLFTVKKKIRQVDPSVPTYYRIPQIVPMSWGHLVKMYNPNPLSTEGIQSLEVIETNDILQYPLEKLGNQYQAIYMDPPILMPGESPDPRKITIQQLAKLEVWKVVQAGFIFVWTEKEYIFDLLQIGEKWGFKCVENYCWVKYKPNNKFVQEPYHVFNKSKLTLLVLRKIKDKDGEIALRHQRNSDVLFDFVKPKLDDEISERKPEYIYEVIETLLPSAAYSPENPSRNKLLELWARRDTPRRTGWTVLIEDKTKN